MLSKRKYIAMSIPVCLFICMFVCNHISGTWHPKLTKSSMHVAWSPSGSVAIHYVRPVLWMMSLFLQWTLSCRLHKY